MTKNDKISILYVEDQDDVRLFLHKILSRHYAHVFLAQNGKEGWEMYKKLNPDIIISDIKMPVMDGLSMSGRIKEHNPNAQIILTTAHSDMEYFIQSIDIGINQYILKPIDREKLFNAIKICANQVLLEKEIERKKQDLINTNEKLKKQEIQLRDSLEKSNALKEIISKSESNFRQLAENVQDAIWLTENNKILYANSSFKDIFGLPTSKLYDDPKAFINLIDKTQRDNFIHELSQHKNDNKFSLSTEFRIKTPSGKKKYLWYRDIYIPAKDGKEIRQVIAVTDISWQKENEKLQQNLLVSEKSLEIKRQFLSNISHEMRTPLNGILSMANILKDSELSNQQKDYTDTIRECGDNLLSIINDLLSFNEIEQGKLTYMPGRINTEKLIKSSTFRHLKERAAEKNLDFNILIKDDFPSCFISDKEKLLLIFRNLIMNAIKFTFNGGVEVVFDSKSINKKQWELEFTVRDTGIGIHKKNLDKIFEVFTQEDYSNSRSHEGLGLGLTVSKNIVEFLKGKLMLKSDYGKGSTFKFELPVEKSELGATNTISSSEVNTLKNPPQLNLDILYAEDKIVNQKVIKIMLENAGCRVKIAQNGKEAVSLAKEQDFNVILMDIQMPEMDGITATQIIKKDSENAPPIIGVSANAISADAQYYLSQGLDDFITKPVHTKELFNKIEFWIKNGFKKNNDQKNDHLIHESKKGNNSMENEENFDQIPDLDKETIDSLKEQTNNDAQIINDLYSTFLEESETLMQSIEKGLTDNDNQQLKDMTHALKGLTATVGAKKMYAITFKMDALHKKGIFNKSASLFSELSIANDKAIHEIKQLIGL